MRTRQHVLAPVRDSAARVDRRDFLERLAVLAGVAALPLPGCGPSRSSPSARKVFDAHEWAVVDAVASRFIPTDDVPGAHEANAVGFIDAQLAEPHFAIFRREVTRGIRVLDRLARERQRVRFDALQPDDQDAVLRAIAGGEGSAGGLDTAHLFQVLFTLTLEGFLSDPVHGGNAGGVGWDVIGYAPSPPHAHRSRHG